MRLHRVWLAVLLAALLAVAMPAQAQSVMEMLEAFGMTEAEAAAFGGVVAEMGDSITEDDIRAMLEEFSGQAASEPLPGTEKDGTYTDPSGLSFPIPEGWTLQPNTIGGYIVLAGQPDEAGFMSTITLVSTPEGESSFLTMEQTEIDALLGASLKNYQPIALDDFEYQSVPAREMVCMYGPDEDAMLMQYQLYFNYEGMAYVITMTTLAEEAAHDSALDTYDSFLANLSLAQGMG